MCPPPTVPWSKAPPWLALQIKFGQLGLQLHTLVHVGGFRSANPKRKNVQATSLVVSTYRVQAVVEL